MAELVPMPEDWQNESGLRKGNRSILHKLDIGHGEIRVDPGEEEPAPAGWTVQHGAPGGNGVLTETSEPTNRRK